MNTPNTEHLIRVASQMILWGSSRDEIAEFLMEETNDGSKSYLLYRAACVMAERTPES